MDVIPRCLWLTEDEHGVDSSCRPEKLGPYNEPARTHRRLESSR